MIRHILLLTTSTSLALIPPRAPRSTRGTSIAGPPTATLFPEATTFHKAVTQGPRPLHIPRKFPKATAFSKITLKVVTQGRRPLHISGGFPKAISSTKTTASPKVKAPCKIRWKIPLFYPFFSLWFLESENKTTTSPELKLTELQKYLIRLNADYDGKYRPRGIQNECSSLNGIQEELKHVWSEITEGGRKHSSGEMNDLHKFLKKVVEDYNLCITHYIYANSEAVWKNYIIAFGKEYTPEEKEMRKTIFMKNKEYMEEHIDLFIRGKISYGTKLNHLSDRTREELEHMKGFLPHKLSTRRMHPTKMLRQNDTRYYHGNPDSEVPISVDWRMKGYVTPVRFQGNCSSCYAFAGIGALEAYHKKRTGNLISLSVQNILDCTWNLSNDGCNGGFIHSVFENARTMGIESDYRYPYTMNASFDCQWKKEHVAVLFEGYVHTVTKGNELALEHAVANHGPVAAAIGTRGGFENYGNGIFHPPDCGPADQSVLIVGYGTDPVQGDYWIIKNNYGEWWGEDGYIRLARNKNNVCDVASHVIFPIFQ